MFFFLRQCCDKLNLLLCNYLYHIPIKFNCHLQSDIYPLLFYALKET